MRVQSVVCLAVVGCFMLSGGAFAEDKPGPKYQNLRYDEDFSYLDGAPGSYSEDLWDPIKWISLGDDWHLTIGGQARLRMESETNKSFGSGARSHDAFLLQRYLIHADLRHGDGLRFFLQGKFAHANDRDLGGLSGMEDPSDFHQGFFDVAAPVWDQKWTVRFGRQELQYGAQRLISPLDWGNLRRSFDGVKVFADFDKWRIDMFAVRPVVADRKNLDDGDENQEFYGVYTTWKGGPRLSTDLYFLALNNDNPTANSNGAVGERELYTIGTRLWGGLGNWDYETELAGQFGSFGRDRVRSWMATVGGGYTFADVGWQPRLGLSYDYASGDEDPTDSTHQTFNQLFPLGHAWLGYLDRIGRSNVHAIKAQLKVKPCQRVVAWADFHTFFADEDQDAMYSAGGAALRRTTTGAGSKTFGHELDLAMKVTLDVHTAALLGFSQMWPGGFVSRTGDDDRASLFYGQIEYKF